MRRSVVALALVVWSLVPFVAGCDTGSHGDLPDTSRHVRWPAGEAWRERRAPDGSWRLAYRPDPDPIPRNELFEIEVAVTDGASLVGVDAWMPEHLHGMTLQPRVQPTGPGRYRVEGMLLHMSGLWELFFEIDSGREGSGTARARFEVPID